MENTRSAINRSKMNDVNCNHHRHINICFMCATFFLQLMRLNKCDSSQKRLWRSSLNVQMHKTNGRNFTFTCVLIIRSFLSLALRAEDKLWNPIILHSINLKKKIRYSDCSFYDETFQNTIETNEQCSVINCIVGTPSCDRPKYMILKLAHTNIFLKKLPFICRASRHKS